MRHPIDLIRLGFVLLPMVCTACGLTGTQRTALRQFSTASATFGDVAAGELIGMRTGVIDMNVARLELARPDGDDPNHTNLDEALTVADLSARTRAAAALANYGTLLRALVDETQKDEIAGAADRFAASVNGLRPADRKLSDDDLDALGEAVEAIGALAVECMKARALATIVPRAKPQIDELTLLLGRDIGADGRFASQYAVTTARLQDVSDGLLDGSNRARPEALAAYRLVGRHRDRYEAIAQVATAAKELRETNARLADLDYACVGAFSSGIDASTLQDVREFGGTVKKIIDGVRVLD